VTGCRGSIAKVQVESSKTRSLPVSGGCVIVNIVTRRHIWESGDHTITVSL